jgi:UDP-3-O-[3-hydroxymyristoyl] glucosamine N-acyltransferase
MRDADAGQVLVGSPALAHKEWAKVQAAIPKLPELRKQVLELEKQLQEMKQKISGS